MALTVPVFFISVIGSTFTAVLPQAQGVAVTLPLNLIELPLNCIEIPLRYSGKFLCNGYLPLILNLPLLLRLTAEMVTYRYGKCFMQRGPGLLKMTRAPLHKTFDLP